MVAHDLHPGVGAGALASDEVDPRVEALGVFAYDARHARVIVGAAIVNLGSFVFCLRTELDGVEQHEIEIPGFHDSTTVADDIPFTRIE